MIRKRLNTSIDYGLSNKEALIKLKTAIQNELEKDEKSSQTSRIPLWLKDAFHHKSSYSSFNWSSVAILCLCIFFLSIYQVYEDQNFRLKSVAFQIFFLTIFLLGNVLIISWDSFLRYGEMRSKIKFLLKSLEGNTDLIPKGDQYFSLHTPQSPCVSVQWTCRDGQLLNLPCSLLVEGDVILMRPGHAAPGHCKSLNQIPNSCHNLKRGQIFATIDESLTDNFNNPRLRKPAQSMKFVMLETPFINRLK